MGEKDKIDLPNTTFDGTIQVNGRVNTIAAMEALFEYATEGILITNTAGEILKINHSAETIFGYEKGELVGKKVEALIPRNHAHEHAQYREKYNKKPHARSMGIGMELYGLKKDGSEFPVEVSLSPFKSEQGRLIIAFVIDITVRKQQEDLLKKSYQELEAANTRLENRVRDRTLILEETMRELERSREELSRSLDREKEVNELKSHFVSMASHEFRTPLTTILSSLSLIAKYNEMGDREKQMKHVEKIKASVGHLTDLLNDFLSVTKLEEGKVLANPEKFDVQKLVTEVIETMQAIAGPGQNINYKHTGSTELELDKKIVVHVLHNLISNSIKFSPEEKPVEVTTRIADNCLSITVKDYGIGISEEDQKHLFERFFRARNAVNIQGTGLGLNIVVNYIKLVGGDIDVKSKLGEGTTFNVTLPGH